MPHGLRKHFMHDRGFDPIDPRNVVFVRNTGNHAINFAENFRGFVELCHDRVTDREPKNPGDPETFSKADRSDLYLEWLKGNQDTLMAVHDGHGSLLVASVILPLKAKTYTSITTGRIDAIDIKAGHIVSKSRGGSYRRYLIDILADNWWKIDDNSIGLPIQATFFHLAYLSRSISNIYSIACDTSREGIYEYLGEAIGFAVREGREEDARLCQLDIANAVDNSVLNNAKKVIASYGAKEFQRAEQGVGPLRYERQIARVTF